MVIGFLIRRAWEYMQIATCLPQSADYISTPMELSTISHASRPPCYYCQQTTYLLQWNSSLSSCLQATSLLQSADYVSTAIELSTIPYTTVPQSADFISTLIALCKLIISHASRPPLYYSQQTMHMHLPQLNSPLSLIPLFPSQQTSYLPQ